MERLQREVLEEAQLEVAHVCSVEILLDDAVEDTPNRVSVGFGAVANDNHRRMMDPGR